MDSLSGLFWDFCSLYQRRCGVVSDALSRQPSSSSTSLRRLRLGVAAQASGTSLSDISTTPTLRRRVSHAEERLRYQRFFYMQGSGCEINACHTISRRHLVMDRPRASRSSSHRDERREGCRVWHACLGTSDPRALEATSQPSSFSPSLASPILFSSFVLPADGNPQSTIGMCPGSGLRGAQGRTSCR